MTILNFPCARIDPIQYLRVFRVWHFHVNPQACCLNFSLIRSILLRGLIFRSNCPPSTLVGFVSFPARYAEQSSAVHCRPCLKELSDLLDFCVLCNRTQSIKFFVCLFVRSFVNRTPSHTAHFSCTHFIFAHMHMRTRRMRSIAPWRCTTLSRL